MPPKEFLEHQWREVWRDYSAGGSFHLLLVVGLVCLRWSVRLSVALILGMIVVEAVGSLIKLFARRMRPDRQTGTSWLERIDSGSFPSIHAARAAAFLVTVAIFLKSLPVGLLLSPFLVLVAASRVILKRHYVSDVLAGCALGLALGWLVSYIAFRT